MIVNALLYGIALIANHVLTSATILTSMKEEGPLRVYNGRPNELEYIFKRSGQSEDPPEQPSSKERRSKLGSNMIRFGRNYFERSPENVNYDKNNLRSQRDKHVEIIRLGRSDFKADRTYRPQHDLNFVRYGRNVQEAPLELDISLICSNALAANDARNNRKMQFLPSKLMVICNDYDGNDDESTRVSNMGFTDDNGDSV